MSTLDAKALNKVLEKAGLSKTVYAFVMPETEQVIEKILGDSGSPERAAFHDMYTEAWTQKQDPMHQIFFETWRNWIKDGVTLGNKYQFAYPTAGASEPIREAIYQYAMQARIDGYEPKIHIFVGEYEGYKAYADAAGIEVIEHDRNHWQDSLNKIEGHHQFYLSQPSAMDGNIWPEYNVFMRTLAEHDSKIKVMLDLTYVGCVARDYHIKADYDSIEQIFFSLSKPFGLYYHRCGGVLSRTESRGLFGNKWFKNLLALKIGTAMMQEFDIHALPRKYQAMQESAATQASQVLGIKVTPCDIFLLGKAAMPLSSEPIHLYLRRNPMHNFVRICLTPTMAHMANTALSAQVSVRPHERLEME